MKTHVDVNSLARIYPIEPLTRSTIDLLYALDALDQHDISLFVATGSPRQTRSSGAS